jgi:indolepyruvate ferredoxin oxidoreductase beta subunit
VLIAFEKLEAMRYAHFLKKDGVIIVNDQRIDPMSVVTGAATYPENIIETLKKDHKVISCDAMAEAKKYGNPKVFNVIIIGVAARQMNFEKDEWFKVIENTVPPKTVDVNKAAFETGWIIGGMI